MKICALMLLVVLALVCTSHLVHSQTNVVLNIQLYPGLSVTGQVGKVYQVQWASGVADTNTWYALQHFELKWNPHEFVDTTCPATEKRFYRAVEVEVPTNVVPVANMVFIPPGTFVMGSPPDEPARDHEEGPQTEVTISRGFWMGAYEVTQGEYSAVMGNNPSWFTNGCPAYSPGVGSPVTNELRHPVENVLWQDATNYCALLTERERAAGRLPLRWEYRLPTEAQWEYACRAGTRTPFHYGSALRSGMANFDGRFEYPPCGSKDFYCYNSSGIFLGRTVEVGNYQPNAWGLYDMHGNVWEWCQDWWTGSLPGGSVSDPAGPVTGSNRVVRSGGWGDWVDWGDYAWHCRSAFRGRYHPRDGYGGLGFRVALVPVP